MKRIIRNPIFTFVIGVIVTSSIVGVLVYNYQANEISYTTNKNSSVENVEQAINDLYNNISSRPYYVEYYDESRYLGKSAHAYGEPSNLIAMLPTNTANCGYTGWSTANGGSKIYDSGASITDLAQPGNSVKLYATKGYTGYVVSSNQNFEAHYTSGIMDACYYTGCNSSNCSSGGSPGTYKNGTGLRCNGGTNGSAYALRSCTENNADFYIYYNCISNLYFKKVTGGLASTKSCT